MQQENLDERNKGIIFTNCAQFTGYISQINNTKNDNAKYIVFVLPMYNLIEYRNNYLKTSGRLWQYYIGNPNNNVNHLNTRLK